MGMFKKAERRKAKLKLALAAPAGGGKSHSSLLMAAGLIDNPGADTIAVLDTENGSAELEAGKPGIPEFSVVQMQAPYSPERYMEVIDEAVKSGFEVLILDSITPEWNGQGGILDFVDKKKSSSRNQMAAWQEATPKHQKFLDAIIQAPIHIICTMRSKTQYDISNEGGRTKVQKLGVAPTQRDGIEFEFTLVGEISVDRHLCQFTKDRTGLFDGQVPEPVSTETGRKIAEWLNSGSDAEPAEAPVFEANPKPAPAQTLTPAKVYEKSAGGKSAMVLVDSEDNEYLLGDIPEDKAEALIGVECTFKAMPRKGLPRLVELTSA